VFRENLFLDELLEELKKTSYTVLKHIMNVDGRIFGVMVQKEMPFFVPCRPSATRGEYEMVDDSLWNNYRNTVYCLDKLAKESKIPCAPKLRVLENELVVGILTETNQFVPLKEPEENKMKDALGVVDEYQRLHIDQTLQKGEVGPKEKVIQHLKLEQMFYHAYFNTLKVALNDSEHLSIRKRIEKAVRRKEKAKVEELLELILEDKFLFIDDYDIDLTGLTHINLCKQNKEPYCGTLEHEGKLLIPNENLFNQSDNSNGYKNRFIDDLLMNVHIQRILFEEIHSTLYYTDRYQMAEDEILLLESDLNTYLDKVPIKKVNSVTFALLEDVQPSRLLEYVDKVQVEEEPEKVDTPFDSESETEDTIPRVKSKSKDKSEEKPKEKQEEKPKEKSPEPIPEPEKSRSKERSKAPEAEYKEEPDESDEEPEAEAEPEPEPEPQHSIH